jgi:hypothetical protein
MRTKKPEMSKILPKPLESHDAKKSRRKLHAEPRSVDEKSRKSASEIDEIKTVVSQLESKIEELYKIFSTQEGKNDYEYLIRKIRAIVDVVLPIESTVIVISKGDNALLNLDGRTGWHFPQTEDGSYAGSYPVNGLDAISYLEALRNKGSNHLLIPSTAFWWMDYYEEFRLHLDRHYRIVAFIDDLCLIYSLEGNTDSFSKAV